MNIEDEVSTKTLSRATETVVIAALVYATLVLADLVPK